MRELLKSECQSDALCWNPLIQQIHGDVESRGVEPLVGSCSEALANATAELAVRAVQQRRKFGAVEVRVG